LSFALIIDQPYGADISYPAAPGSVALGGTKASLDSNAITGMLRYEFGNGFSVHGGIRAQRTKGNVTLSGLAYGGLDGYNVAFSGDTAWGYQGGVAYERPDIAMRVALTYFSEIDHNFTTAENFAPGVVSSTAVTTPQAFNLDFQSGIAVDTLLFGQIRWVDWSAGQLTPQTFGALTGGLSLTEIEDETTFTLGVGRKFTDQFSGAISIQYENGGNDLVSPLAPTNGKIGLTVGGSYTVDNMKISGGINYTKIGDALPRTAGVARANFEGNSAFGIGLKVGYSF
jgi:long-subunit fatty acid transport protein